MADTPAAQTKLTIAVCAAVASLWGSLPVIVQMLLIVMSLDVLSGITRAACNGRLSSRLSFKGMLRKSGVLICVGLAIIVEQYGGNLVPLGSMTAAFFVATEGMSVLENLKSMGVPLPRVLCDALDTMRKDAERRQDGDDGPTGLA